MSRFKHLPLRTRVLGALSKPMDFLPKAPAGVLKAVQRAGIHPLIEKAVLGAPQALPKVVQETVDTGAGRVDVRLYYPITDAVLPVVMFMHAGGWVIGNLASHDAFCRRIAHATGALVIAVDYHLAPWAKFPTPVRQGEGVFAWIQREHARLNADPERIVVMGDSAGGNLSAVLAQKFPDRLKGQILIYPVIDGAFNAPSVEENKDAPILSKKLMGWFFDCYQRTPVDRDDPEFSPIRAKDLRGLPPCLIITADYDVLRDDGFAYANALRDAGVSVRHVHYPDVHGFISFPTLCANSVEATEEVRRFITGQLVLQ